MVVFTRNSSFRKSRIEFPRTAELEFRVSSFDTLQDFFSRLRVVSLSLSPSSETRKKTAREKMAVRDPGDKKLAGAAIFFLRGFLSRLARRTKRKREYS